MRDSVSNLSDDDFCRAVAGLVEADYIAGCQRRSNPEHLAPVEN